MEYKIIRENKPEEKKPEFIFVKPKEAPRQVIMAPPGKTKEVYCKEGNFESV